MKLTAQRVSDIFRECLFRNDEPTDNHVRGEGINATVGFHPERLKKFEPEIEELLQELPDEFKKGTGDGMSFLQMCQDKDGNQWADSHKTMDELLILGLATGKLKYLLPRDMWKVLPGGMPYLVIN